LTDHIQAQLRRWKFIPSVRMSCHIRHHRRHFKVTTYTVNLHSDIQFLVRFLVTCKIAIKQTAISKNTSTAADVSNWTRQHRTAWGCALCRASDCFRVRELSEWDWLSLFHGPCRIGERQWQLEQCFFYSDGVGFGKDNGNESREDPLRAHDHSSLFYFSVLHITVMVLTSKLKLIGSVVLRLCHVQLLVITVINFTFHCALFLWIFNKLSTEYRCIFSPGSCAESMFFWLIYGLCWFCCFPCFCLLMCVSHVFFLLICVSVCLHRVW